jgi:hypothetical protein
VSFGAIRRAPANFGASTPDRRIGAKALDFSHGLREFCTKRTKDLQRAYRSAIVFLRGPLNARGRDPLSGGNRCAKLERCGASAPP